MGMNFFFTKKWVGGRSTTKEVPARKAPTQKKIYGIPKGRVHDAPPAAHLRIRLRRIPRCVVKRRTAERETESRGLPLPPRMKTGGRMLRIRPPVFMPLNLLRSDAGSGGESVPAQPPGRRLPHTWQRHQPKRGATVPEKPPAYPCRSAEPCKVSRRYV